MSSYNPRPGPNISQYLAGLNTVSPEQETQNPNFEFEDDLALFTNTEFLFDGDNAGIEFSGQDAQQTQASKEGGAAGAPAAAGKDATDMKELDFDNGQYQFPNMDFGPNSTGPSPLPPMLNLGQQAPAATGFDVTYSPTSYSPVTPSHPHTGDKRAFSQSADNLEANSRAAAEEDKRRRNTAASARFRVKKKQREQALEKTAKEMGDKVDALEGRISELERENKWLRSLVVEKSSDNKDEVASMLQKFTEEARSSSAVKKGVGTVKNEGEAA